ncbi:MAG: hypothetical protein WDZ69_03585 [Candidatus Pacearchaeota archaeon]
MGNDFYIKKVSRIAIHQSKRFYKWMEGKIIPKSHLTSQSLMKARPPKNRDDHKLIFCFNPGRSGTRWLSNIFNAHENWIGTCERFGQYESFVRYCAWHDLNVDLESAFKLFEQAIYYDFEKHQNSMIVSPFFNFIIPKMVQRYNPDHIFFVYRNPVDTVCSFHERGFYKDKVFTSNDSLKKATISISATGEIRSLSPTFSRILPQKQLSLKEWNKLTRIGKCTWFWVTQMKAMQDAYFNVKGVKKRVYSLEEMDQNYPFYEKLVKEHNLIPKLGKKDFLSLKKIVHPEKENIHPYDHWTDKEKEEFHEIIKKAKLKYPFNKFNINKNL